jgi:hypothetical protein
MPMVRPNDRRLVAGSFGSSTAVYVVLVGGVAQIALGLGQALAR